MGVLDPSNAELTFPSAEYVIGETELGYWTQPKHPLENDARGDIYSENIKTIAKIKDKIRTVKAGGDVVTGISVVATPRACLGGSDGWNA